MTPEVQIERPVFVISTGRSGLTPLMDLIAYHPDFGWPSQYNDKFPGSPRLSLLSRIVDYPPFDGKLKSRLKPLMPAHDESWDWWGNLYHGFPMPNRDLVAKDVTPWVRARIRRGVRDLLRYHGKPRFIAELSGWSRVRFLKSIFPDASFIHIVRDGRAVANSLTHVPWWKGWEGYTHWRISVPEPEMLEKLEKYERSFLALAGIYWKILIRNLVEATSALPEQEFLLVRYEDLVEDPRGKAIECIAFAGLDGEHRKFRRHLSTVAIVDANRSKMRIPSWRKNMSTAQIAMLEDILGDELALFQYT